MENGEGGERDENGAIYLGGEGAAVRQSPILIASCDVIYKKIGPYTSGDMPGREGYRRNWLGRAVVPIYGFLIGSTLSRTYVTEDLSVDQINDELNQLIYVMGSNH